MTTIQFYHLTTTHFERALPKLLEKAYGGGYKTLLLVENETRAEQLNQLLWTYDPSSFLPHGTNGDEPIVITCHPRARHEDPSNKSLSAMDSRVKPENDKTLLFITNGHFPEAIEPYARIIDLFDGNNDLALHGARTRWKRYKDAGHELTYYQQTEAGGWAKAG